MELDTKTNWYRVGYFVAIFNYVSLRNINVILTRHRLTVPLLKKTQRKTKFAYKNMQKYF